MRTTATFVMLCLASGCMIIPPEDQPDAAIEPPIPPDAGVVTGGGGGGGGGGGVIPPEAAHGVGQLWLVRIDHGAANTAASVQALVEATTSAIAAAKVDLVGSAVASLYEPARVIWAQNPKAPPSPITIANAIAAQAAPDTAPPSSCPTAMLFQLGSALRSLFAGAILAFPTPPAALFVGIVDHGARPVPLSVCGDPVSGLAADPAGWVQTGVESPPRLRVRIAWIATPESGTTAALRDRCAATPGIPASVIDVVDPSAASFYDPLLSSLAARAPGLAAPLDLCNAFAAPSSVASAVSVWLAGLRLP